MNSRLPVAAIGAWLLVAVYYFYQYALRSAPSVMMPQLSDAFSVNALGVSAIVGMFYYGYSPSALLLLELARFCSEQATWLRQTSDDSCKAPAEHSR